MNAATTASGSSIIVADRPPAWGWFVALGAALIILGGLAFANLNVATIVSVLYVGLIIAAGGVAQVVHAFRERSWSGFVFWLLAGLLYGLAGVLVWLNPLFGAVALTLILAASLMGSGMLRVWLGIKLRPLSGWGWVIVSGAVTISCGLVFLIGWPVNSLWLLGVFLAIDLLVQGVTALAFGLMLRSAPETAA